MRDTIRKLDLLLKEEARRMERFINVDEPYESDIFDLPIHMSASLEHKDRLKGRRGIYVILFSEPALFSKDKVEEWCSIPGAGIKDRNNPMETTEWDCLYLGSSVRNSLFVRFGQHFGDRECSALRLHNPHRSWILPYLQVYCFCLKKDVDENYRRLILTGIEEKLHETMIPLAGSKRV